MKLTELDLSHLYILREAVNNEISRKETIFDEEEENEK
jgi:hypothetical protein